MKKALVLVLIASLVLPLISCGQPAAGELLKSDKERITSPDVSPSDEALLDKAQRQGR